AGHGTGRRRKRARADARRRGGDDEGADDRIDGDHDAERHDHHEPRPRARRQPRHVLCREPAVVRRRPAGDALALSATYEELRASHRWRVPARYNIAADVCDKHPRDKQAMIWESFDASVRELAWGELQDLANQAAHTLAERGIVKGDRVAVLLPPTPEAAAIFFGVWKLGGVLLAMSVLYGDAAVQHRLNDSEAKLVVTDRANLARFDADAQQLLLAEEGAFAGAPTDHVCEATSADDPAQL